MSGKAVVADAVSIRGDSVAAFEEATAEIQEKVGGSPDIVLAFFSPHHREGAGKLLDVIQRDLTPDAITGSSMSGVIGGGREHQAGPGISLWAARLPGARLQTYRLSLDDKESRIGGWPEVPESASAVMLVEPFSFPLEPFFESLRKMPSLPTMLGGIASGADRAGENILLHDDTLVQSGAVGFVLDGGYRFETVLARGCRPVGPPFLVTRSEGNVVYELGGRSAYSELSEVLIAIGEKERNRFMRAPHIGIQPLESTSGEAGSDSLIRGLMGVDPDAGAIAVSDHVEEGEMLQFQSRDREFAHEQMESALKLAGSFDPEVLGALIFDCTARGLHLFQRADHDIEMMHKLWPDLPSAGCFAAGEIAPVCGLPYIHGLSASIGLLVPSE
ncbi:MAG: FIST N-terminal domain-containing protein [Planctomycetota bacterium]